MSKELSPRVWVAEFEWGTVYGGESPREVQAYGIKHRNRFGRPLRVRPATEDDPIDDYRITYTFNEGSPARQRYEARMRAKAEAKAEKRHPGQLQLFNPSTGLHQPVELITDRAKRYRAQAANQQPERVCMYCGKRAARLDVEHINGREADNDARNLGYACRPCNTSKGQLFAALGLGTKTQQFNPAAQGAASAGQYAMAVDSIQRRDKRTGRLMGWQGKARPMDVRAAVAMIRATPPADRSRFAREIWASRRAHGTDRRGSEVPF